MSDIDRAVAAGLTLPERTYPLLVGTVGICIVTGHTISVHCDTYGCHHRGMVDLVEFALKHGVDHGSQEKDLKPHFFCQKCKVARRPHKNISFILHAPTGPRSYAQSKGI